MIEMHSHGGGSTIDIGTDVEAKGLVMRSRIARALATGIAAGVLASGAAVASAGPTFAAPATSTGLHVTTKKHCRTVKGHYRHVHGKKVWVKPYKVCRGGGRR